MLHLTYLLLVPFIYQLLLFVFMLPQNSSRLHVLFISIPENSYSYFLFQLFIRQMKLLSASSNFFCIILTFQESRSKRSTHTNVPEGCSVDVDVCLWLLSTFTTILYFLLFFAAWLLSLLLSLLNKIFTENCGVVYQLLTARS